MVLGGPEAVAAGAAAVEVVAVEVVAERGDKSGLFLAWTVALEFSSKSL